MTEPRLSDLLEVFTETATTVSEAWDDNGQQAGDDTSPAVLMEAMIQLIDLLRRFEADLGPGGSDDDISGEVTKLGAYGATLLDQLAGFADQLGLPRECRDLENLQYPLALWVARAGGELRDLETLVDVVAHVANNSDDTDLLGDVSSGLGEILDAAAEDIRQDMDDTDPGRPWRLLHLNRGVVATRSLNPRIMEIAFRALADNMPDDAAQFFREGMEQMETLNYPATVRGVMERYFLEHCTSRTLH